MKNPTPEQAAEQLYPKPSSDGQDGTLNAQRRTAFLRGVEWGIKQAEKESREVDINYDLLDPENDY